MRLLVTLAILALSAPAIAQPHFTIWADDDGFLVSAFTVPPSPDEFDVVVTLDSDGHQSAAAEWVMTWLPTVAPGVFHTGTASIALPLSINCGARTLSTCSPGEVLFAFGCRPASGQLELVRYSFMDVSGVVPPDTVIALRGYQPGDTMPSSFDGQPGFVDCNDVAVPGEMGGTPGGRTLSGVEFPPGSLILNPTLPLPSASTSFGMIKAQY